MTKNLLAIVFLLVSGSMEAMEPGKKSPVQSKGQNDKAAQAAAQFRQSQPHKGTRRSISLGDEEEDAPLEGLKPGQQVQRNKRAKIANARSKAQFETQRRRDGLAAKAGDVNFDDEYYYDGYTDEDDNY
jgi:hypothetical protein